MLTGFSVSPKLVKGPTVLQGEKQAKNYNGMQWMGIERPRQEWKILYYS